MAEIKRYIEYVSFENVPSADANRIVASLVFAGWTAERIGASNGAHVRFVKKLSLVDPGHAERVVAERAAAALELREVVGDHWQDLLIG